MQMKGISTSLAAEFCSIGVFINTLFEMGHWKRIPVRKMQKVNNALRELMEKWKCSVEELSGVIAQVIQGQMISTISTLLMSLHCPTATNSTAGSAEPKAVSIAALQRS